MNRGELGLFLANLHRYLVSKGSNKKEEVKQNRKELIKKYVTSGEDPDLYFMGVRSKKYL